MEINIDSQSVVEFLPMMFAIMIGMCIVLWIIVAVKNKENESLPIMRAHAVLLEKPQETPGGIAIVVATTFQLDDGRRVRLSVPAKHNLIVGDKGMLTWQGTAFRSFTLDTNSQ